MPVPETIEHIIRELPDPEAARRFYSDLSERHPAAIKRTNDALLSDLLTIASYSPLLSTAILQNPEYIAWLARERSHIAVRSKEELLESLSRFALMSIDVSPNVMLARFRRRELLRIYLRDIRRLATIAEITEELSNLADAIIEFSLRLAKQELENRFGTPLETDEKGRSHPADFCVVALGKLGSKELNYSSDIDLLFIYSREGKTSDIGKEGSVTNREYFIKLSERIIAIAGGQSGEGAAYRIDMRLRPRGTIGALALSLEETIRYYAGEAREWEQQVLIRSRPIAGNFSIYKEFYSTVEDFIFIPETDVAKCLANVRLSKRRIEEARPPGPGYNVKLGRGGIREIEFIAQALQLAYGGADRWLRFPHTLVSLTRLAERELITDRQLTQLYEAYDFLRRLEHRLQMEHGLQTHTIPKNESAHRLISRRMGFSSLNEFDDELRRHTSNVQGVFIRVFGETVSDDTPSESPALQTNKPNEIRSLRQRAHDKIAAVSPHFAQMFAAVPDFEGESNGVLEQSLSNVITSESDFGKRLSLLRRAWSKLLLEIVLAEIDGKIDVLQSKLRQTELAALSIEAALRVTKDEISARYSISDLQLSVLSLGKLGGGRVDYGSDLDIALVYEDDSVSKVLSPAELYNRAVEIFVTTLSGMTRDGNLYRVDLRLRPYGKNGASANSESTFIDYFKNMADVWEFLAFVKLRGITGRIADRVESEVRHIIHERASAIEPGELRRETIRIRNLLEKQKAGRRSEVDIKYGAGGMLDVYFATRYLQLRDNIPDDAENRSTLFVLDKLRERGSLSEPDYGAFSDGYRFISELDHSIRLVTGRSRQLPRDPEALRIIINRTGIADTASLLETLSIHRLNIRGAFERVLEIR
jgi:glutamine synthetase adenylyltransferase